MRHILLVAACVAAASPMSIRSAHAQANTPGDSAARGARGRELPLTPTLPVKFTTDEGTWMSLDLSPDGKSILFDMMGDIYTLPAAGGTARRLTSGQAFDLQPRYSPDGRSIVFVSDRSGSDNLWVMDADGGKPRALTKDEKRQFVSPAWTPDGKYIVVSKNAAQFGALYDLYLYHKDGGTGIKMTNAAAPPPAPGGAPPTPAAGLNNYVGAAFGANARYIYAAARNGAGGYNQTSFGWQVGMYDRETGKTYIRTNALGSGMRPVLSPDGKWLAYASRNDSVTALRLRDLASGDERWLIPKIQRDDQESRFTRDLLPGYTFTSDSKALVISYGGKMWRVGVPDGQATPIPFTAEVDQMLGGAAKFAYAINDSTLTVGQIRDVRPSPDGKRIAFTALDRLWTMDLPSGKPARVTNGRTSGEFEPAWSPDGRYIAYVTWSEDGGDVYRVRADGRSQPERLTKQSAFYEKLAYSPDGSRLVVARGPREQRKDHDELGGGGDQAAGIELVWLPAAGGALTVITPLTRFGQPHFSRDTARVYIYDPADGLVSMRFDGTDRRAILKATGNVDYRQATPRPDPANEILLSPDGERALVQVNNKLFVVDVPVTGGATPTVGVANPATAPVPVRLLTRIGGDFPSWNRDGRHVQYAIGRSYFSYDLVVADSLVRDSTLRADSIKTARGVSVTDSAARTVSAATDTAHRTKPAYEPVRTDVTITVPKDRPSGVVVLRNARIVTMKGKEVIERGDIVIRDNRIAAVGATGSVPIPAGAHAIDVAGKTILPGYVDVHAHIWPAWGIHRTQVWEYLINMAYGVTTTRDPQTSTTDVLSYGDLVETGDIIGPRIFSTGPGVFWSDNISSLADARDVLHRYSDYYNTHTIKQYMVGDRKVRQWVIMAAKELGLMPTLEGGLDFKKNLTEAMDGYSGSEHTYPIAPLYKDAVQLIAESGITYTPTLIVEYGGPWAENYWYEHYDITTDPKVGHFMPRRDIEQRGLRRPGWWHDSQYSFSLFAEQAAKIVAAGGRVGLGSHGQMQGLGAHWELWSIASGGMPNHDVLRVGTILGAESIGLAKDLGSLEAGKLADLQVLDKNPLDDIRNTNTVRQVMKNGRLYDAATMNEVWPRQRVVSRVMEEGGTR